MHPYTAITLHSESHPTLLLRANHFHKPLLVRHTPRPTDPHFPLASSFDVTTEGVFLPKDPASSETLEELQASYDGMPKLSTHFPPFPTRLHLTRFDLVPLTASRAPFLADLVRKNKGMPFFDGWSLDDPFTLTNRLATYSALFALGLRETYLMESLIPDIDSPFFGVLTVHHHSDELYELGYWVDASHHGQGFATAAVRTITDLIFSSTKVSAIQIRCDVDNQASSKVANKAGYTYKGTGPIPNYIPSTSGKRETWMAYSPNK